MTATKIDDKDLNEKIVISEIAVTVTSRATEITIDKAIEILKAAKRADPEASVDLIIHHVKSRRVLGRTC